MAVGFDTPLGGLALEMAYRNMEAKKKALAQGQYEQDLVSKRLMGTGDSMANYQNVWDRGYSGAQNAAAAQAQALQDYWVGLPEIMVAAAKEGQASGQSSTTSPYPTLPTTTEKAPAISPSTGLPYAPSPATRVSPDVLDRPRAKPRTGGTIKARRLTPITVRQGR